MGRWPASMALSFRSPTAPAQTVAISSVPMRREENTMDAHMRPCHPRDPHWRTTPPMRRRPASGMVVSFRRPTNLALSVAISSVRMRWAVNTMAARMRPCTKYPCATIRTRGTGTSICRAAPTPEGGRLRTRAGVGYTPSE
ncbi:hypothetical protein B0H14DRAFT_2825719 [Mycena olivaceomarginata]|nr:hypothetical protein B0H14DRAFT_2825719 [Mycena olivaceomarginata]